MSNIRNKDIDKFIKNEKNENIKNNIKDVYSPSTITKYINFEKISKKNKPHHLFLILNTSRENKPGVQWWSRVIIDPKMSYYLFDSESFVGLIFYYIK